MAITIDCNDPKMWLSAESRAVLTCADEPKQSGKIKYSGCILLIDPQAEKHSALHQEVCRQSGFKVASIMKDIQALRKKVCDYTNEHGYEVNGITYKECIPLEDKAK